MFWLEDLPDGAPLEEHERDLSYNLFCFFSSLFHPPCNIIERIWHLLRVRWFILETFRVRSTPYGR